MQLLCFVYQPHLLWRRTWLVQAGTNTGGWTYLVYSAMHIAWPEKKGPCLVLARDTHHPSTADRDWPTYKLQRPLHVQWTRPLVSWPTTCTSNTVLIATPIFQQPCTPNTCRSTTAHIYLSMSCYININIMTLIPSAKKYLYYKLHVAVCLIVTLTVNKLCQQHTSIVVVQCVHIMYM